MNQKDIFNKHNKTTALTSMLQPKQYESKIRLYCKEIHVPILKLFRTNKMKRM